jgi:hypothetical protein
VPPWHRLGSVWAAPHSVMARESGRDRPTFVEAARR